MEVSVCATPLLSLLIVSATGISKNVLDEVENNKVLSDESINRASILLASQLGEEIDGLRTPLPVEFGKKALYPRVLSKTLARKRLRPDFPHWDRSLGDRNFPERYVLVINVIITVL